jgi:hypothetical protein
MRYIWPVSTGRDEMATPNGVYTPQRLERSWFSTAYYNSPMPYSIFFHNGYAIHGSYAIDRLGGPASHGCVRLHPHHAALLFDLVQQEGPANTTIEVTDEARPEEPPLPGHEVAAGRGLYPSVPKIVRYRDIGDMPELPPALRGNRPIAARNILSPRPAPTVTDEARPDEPSLSGREIPSLPGREIAAEQGPYPSAPRIVRYRETGGMPELPPAQRGNRSVAVRNVLPRSPAPAGHRPMPTDVVAEGSSPEQAQQAPSIYGFKVLPASCWSGGASRWRWWASSQGTPCK